MKAHNFVVPPKRKGLNANLPPRLHYKNGRYWYVTTTRPRKWIKLSKDKNEALRQWAELEGAPQLRAVTFETAWQKYEQLVLPRKALRTQSDNHKEAKLLMAVFGQMRLEDIEAQHVHLYMAARNAPIRATREKALLSHVFNKAREWGLTNAPNPCAGIKGAQAGREVYVEDDLYERLHKEACRPLRDAMELALLIGQRPADVLRLRHTDVRDGFLAHRQGKTGKRQRIEVIGALAELLDRFKAQARDMPVAALHLILNEKGQPMTHRTLQDRFRKARDRSGIPKDDFQFRDLRAKTASDLEDLALAQRLLGHSNRTMTEHYVRNRKGDKASPLR